MFRSIVINGEPYDLDANHIGVLDTELNVRRKIAHTTGSLPQYYERLQTPELERRLVLIDYAAKFRNVVEETRNYFDEFKTIIAEAMTRRRDTAWLEQLALLLTFVFIEKSVKKPRIGDNDSSDLQTLEPALLELSDKFLKDPIFSRMAILSNSRNLADAYVAFETRFNDSRRELAKWFEAQQRVEQAYVESERATVTRSDFMASETVVESTIAINIDLLDLFDEYIVSENVPCAKLVLGDNTYYKVWTYSELSRKVAMDADESRSSNNDADDDDASNVTQKIDKLVLYCRNSAVSQRKLLSRSVSKDDVFEITVTSRVSRFVSKEIPKQLPHSIHSPIIESTSQSLIASVQVYGDIDQAYVSVIREVFDSSHIRTANLVNSVDTILSRPKVTRIRGDIALPDYLLNDMVVWLDLLMTQPHVRRFFQIKESHNILSYSTIRRFTFSPDQIGEKLKFSMTDEEASLAESSYFTPLNVVPIRTKYILIHVTKASSRDVLERFLEIIRNVFYWYRTEYNKIQQWYVENLPAKIPSKKALATGRVKDNNRGGGDGGVADAKDDKSRSHLYRLYLEKPEAFKNTKSYIEVAQVKKSHLDMLKARDPFRYQDDYARSCQNGKQPRLVLPSDGEIKVSENGERYILIDDVKYPVKTMYPIDEKTKQPILEDVYRYDIYCPYPNLRNIGSVKDKEPEMPCCQKGEDRKVDPNKIEMRPNTLTRTSNQDNAARLFTNGLLPKAVFMTMRNLLGRSIEDFDAFRVGVTPRIDRRRSFLYAIVAGLYGLTTSATTEDQLKASLDQIVGGIIPKLDYRWFTQSNPLATIDSMTKYLQTGHYDSQRLIELFERFFKVRIVVFTKLKPNDDDHGTSTNGNLELPYFEQAYLPDYSFYSNDNDNMKKGVVFVYKHFGAEADKLSEPIYESIQWYSTSRSRERMHMVYAPSEITKSTKLESCIEYLKRGHSLTLVNVIGDADSLHGVLKAHCEFYQKHYQLAEVHRSLNTLYSSVLETSTVRIRYPARGYLKTHSVRIPTTEHTISAVIYDSHGKCRGVNLIRRRHNNESSSRQTFTLLFSSPVPYVEILPLPSSQSASDVSSVIERHTYGSSYWKHCPGFENDDDDESSMDPTTKSICELPSLQQTQQLVKELSIDVTQCQVSSSRDDDVNNTTVTHIIGSLGGDDMMLIIPIRPTSLSRRRAQAIFETNNAIEYKGDLAPVNYNNTSDGTDTVSTDIILKTVNHMRLAGFIRQLVLFHFVVKMKSIARTRFAASSRLVSENDDLSRLEQQTIAEILNEYFAKHTVVHDAQRTYQIQEIPRKVSLNISVFFHEDGRLILLSERMQSSLRSFLAIALYSSRQAILSQPYDHPNDFTFKFRDYYMLPEDFHNSPGQLVFMNDLALKAWRDSPQRSKIAYTVNSPSNRISDKRPYFIQNWSLSRIPVLVQNVFDHEDSTSSSKSLAIAISSEYVRRGLNVAWNVRLIEKRASEKLHDRYIRCRFRGDLFVNELIDGATDDVLDTYDSIDVQVDFEDGQSKRIFHRAIPVVIALDDTNYAAVLPTVVQVAG